MTRRRRYDAEAEAAQPDVVDWEVRVPRGEAATLGLAFGLLVALVVGKMASDTDLAWWAVPVRAAWIGTLAGGGLFFLLFGLHALTERKDRRQARAPQGTRLEVDGTPPEPERRMARLRLDIQTGGQHRLLDVDVTAEMQEFARRVLLWRADVLAPLGLAFAEAPAAGVGFDGFLALRDEMMARGLLRWKNPDNHKSGYVFRAGFDEAMRYIASYPLPDLM